MSLTIEACYIEVDEDEPFEGEVGRAGGENGTKSDDQTATGWTQWSNLPDHILERIFAHLTIKERYYASLTCYGWYRAFYLPRVWSNFLVEDATLGRMRYNYYSGWQPVLDHSRLQSCLLSIGHLIRGLDFRPQVSFNNMFQFMSLISWAMEQNARASGCPREWAGCGQRIRSLNYLFPCNMALSEDPESIKLFGTGGQLLAALKRLMFCLTDLQSLSLVDLILERYEANHLLDEVLESCCLVLRRLCLVNVTSCHCPIMHIGLFLNLQVLVVSPQNVDDDVLTLLADSKVKHLTLLQNRYTPPALAISPCSAKAWLVVRRDNPRLRVHLRVESTTNAVILLQPEAPVASMIYQTPKTMITSDQLVAAVDAYKYTLTVYGHEQLPTVAETVPVAGGDFQERPDSLLVLLARSCPGLNALMIRECISTATILLIARAAQNLRHLYVNRAQVRLGCDWPRCPEWSDEFYDWLQTTAGSLDATEREVSRILDHPYWHLLSAEQFQMASLTRHVAF
uniref:F-box domain-containing protein n=1 Tax=Anopheles dirus TaxID=7168 RepID=A0A182N2U6_9DIPT